MSLDGDGAEQLRLDLTQFDCMLFVEQLLALAWSQSFDQFAAHTQRLRYRDGEVSYCNRWHYFHDWVGSAVRQGMLDPDVVLEGEISRSIPLNFMSSNRSLYPKLQSNDLFDCISTLEASRRVQQRFIPLEAIESLVPSLQSVICSHRDPCTGPRCQSHRCWSDRHTDAIHAAPGQGDAFLDWPIPAQSPMLSLVIVRPSHWQQPAFSRD